MSGTVMYRTCSTGRRRIVGLRINGDEQSLTHWGRVSGRDPVEIRRRLKTMSPYDAVYRDALIVQPNAAWPVPPSTLAITKHTGR
jgi:predicted transcriptional regulator